MSACEPGCPCGGPEARAAQRARDALAALRAQAAIAAKPEPMNRAERRAAARAARRAR